MIRLKEVMSLFGNYLLGIALAAVLLAVLWCFFLLMKLAHGGEAQAQDTRRQFYEGRWIYDPVKKHYYQRYFYKVSPTDKAYHVQLIVYNPTVSRDWVYWYNPDTEKFWGRNATCHHPDYGVKVSSGTDYWSVLPMQFRQKEIIKINQNDYGPVLSANEIPVIPGANDGVKMSCFRLEEKYLPKP